MNVLRHTDSNYSDRLPQLMAASSLFDPVVEQRTRDIVEAVRNRGDAALIELTERFDGPKLFPDQLAVTTAELLRASVKADESLRGAVATASKNIERFGRRSLRKNWSMRNVQGGRAGEKFDPIQRVGVYIPGGTAPLASTALMTILLGKVAGCREIVVCTPADKMGAINPSLLFAINMAGATEIYRLGGAQAIAAMALGTSTVQRVQKIFGPGNAYVVAAKRLLYGHVAVDLLPGPSEVLVLADDSAEPKFIAADLLAQAEHGSGYERVWLVTPSSKLLASVEKEITRQLPKLSRRALIERALSQNGWLIQVENIELGIKLTNQLAPEHCEIMTRNAESVAANIVTAGAIFLGPYSPTVLGDYVAGPSHTLPTGGAGASFSGLTVDQFQRRTSLVAYNHSALQKSLRAIQKFAEVEGLDAHSRSAELRMGGQKAKAIRKAKGTKQANR
ncbi:MAG: histidinol dehydrogenase [Verrucomicrobia bacterium]|nr:histidinol dehydrogenase [Verrucomicrobiota bacterium]